MFMERYLMLSDAAKEVQVESHVLRYWEEELHLPIRRNELGHRYYTEDDVELFKQIKSMKEGGLQLKAIKMILKDGKLNVMVPEEEASDRAKGTDEKTGNDKTGNGKAGDVKAIREKNKDAAENMAIQIIGSREVNPAEQDEREEKAKRLQWLLQQLIRETLQENNRELCQEIKESVVKELDYQFRVQEEREEERDRLREKREEEHFEKLDELLRKKSRGGKMDRRAARSEKKAEEKLMRSMEISAPPKEEMAEEHEAENQKEEQNQKEEHKRNDAKKAETKKDVTKKSSTKKASQKDKVTPEEKISARKKKYFIF